jgi:phytoene/squalene synthetase
MPAQTFLRPHSSTSICIASGWQWQSAGYRCGSSVRRRRPESASQQNSAAAEAIAACPRHQVRPPAVMLAIYRALLHELLARGRRHLDEPVRIPGWRKLALVLRHGLAGR